MNSVAEKAADVFQQHRSELGFVNKAQCREKSLYTESRNGEIVGAALVNHCVRKAQTTLYELAVLPEYRRDGIGETLIHKVVRASPHNKIVAKCPKELPANDFYASTGWEQIDREEGKKRALNVWEKDISGIDIITTGRPDLTEYAAKHGWLRGCRLDAIKNYERAEVSPEFIDIHWEEPDRDSLLTKAMQHEPKYIVAGDYDGDNFDTINNFASKLRQFAENVIIVPHKSGEIEKVPEWALVGYSTPSAYAGTEAPIWEYYGRDIHILGGTMNNIKFAIDHLGDNVVSLDTNTHHRDATQYGEYWSISKPNRKKHQSHLPCIRKTYENSVLNMTYAFEQWGLLDAHGH